METATDANGNFIHMTDKPKKSVYGWLLILGMVFYTVLLGVRQLHRCIR